MIVIDSTEKSKCVNIFSDHGESVIFNGDPVWYMAIDDGHVHLSIRIRDSDDTLPHTCNIGHCPKYVYNVFKSENVTDDTPVVGKRITWSLDAVQTTTVNDQTGVPVGPIEIYPGFSEKTDLLRLVDDSLSREEMMRRIQRYYQILDETRLALFQHKDQADNELKAPVRVVDPVVQVLKEALP